MSSFEEDWRTTPVGDGLIDRLVDGELDEAARAALLGRLDAEPGGWRRCALAFLEAQAWREAVSPIVDTGAIPGSPRHPFAEPIEERPAHRFRPGRWLRLGPASIAAAVVVAFGAGWLASNASRGDGAAPAELPALAGSQAPAVLVEAAPVGRDVDLENQAARNATPVSFHEDGGYPGQAGPELPLSGPVRRQLEARGFRIERHQSLMSMGLNDGGTVALPVDEVEVRYVGNRVY